MPRGPSAASRRTARRALDRRFETMRPLAALAVVPRGGWVQAVREALGMSAADLARRMGTAQTTVLRLEAAERDARIQFDTLRRAAEALDCDVVYALVPRRPLEATIGDRARLKAGSLVGRVGHSMLLEDQQVLPTAARDQLDEQAALLIDRPGLWRDA